MVAFTFARQMKTVCKLASASANGQVPAICSLREIGRANGTRRHSNAQTVEIESSLPWLTERFGTANLNNEYAARAHGGGFISKPHYKERKTKSYSAV